MSQRECSDESCGRSSCEGCEKRQQEQQSMQEPLNSKSAILKKTIGVVSGKGGVGKSFVTASLATALAKKGYRVGILDADITGPSIPKMFGLDEHAVADEDGVYPVETKEGIRVMSINLLLENADDPVIWRGPIISGVVKQFWNEVIWGELDYMLIDMPPGTGDVPLTVFQSIAVDGIVLVTSPQDLVSMIVKKAYNMARTMGIPMVGVVENFSYMECPDCGKKLYPFGESHLEEIASPLGLRILGRVPIMPEASRQADAGTVEDLVNDYFEEAVRVITE
ncbi:MAG: Mrp/NBP35 family ATP-binding protein [Lachnospiraceae bacterium]|nr:Mrp/NBP35 family ATP-binding protein [Lachnospiraceae bacterium]